MKYQELKIMAKDNGIKLSKVVNNKRKLLTKKELEAELSKLNKNEVKENKKELSKQIIVPKGKSAVINIYMTQNNKPSHVVEERKGVIHHNVSIPKAEPTLNIQTPTEIKEVKKWAPVETKYQVIDNRPESINTQPKEIKKGKKGEQIVLPTEELTEEKKAETQLRLNELIQELEEKGDLMNAIQKGVAERTVKKLKKVLGLEGSGKYRNLKGEGLGDWLSNLKNVLSNPTEALYKMPKQIFEQLQKYGNEQIKNIYVCRQPLEAKNKLLLNIITLGGFKKASENYGYYDDIFHLYLVFELENKKLLLVERNQRVIIKETTDAKIKIKDVITININKKLTLNEMFKSAIMSDKKLFYYDPISHNCQNFVSILLNSSGLLNENINKFVNQDVKNLLTGYSKSIASKVIDFASLAQNIYQGGEL